ncbi:Putative pentatricopeptide repeat-containing protein [Apostasia shenzhenica]|uniref:Pentatricopeptide repeat-containing protein n=1 Tax=Apostasia shenzhenica TaxID=1088818 RepID=A0A2I0B0D1_9ASPA|nr:Putative pentatricopeptide repeat-containing protein [Apostasia shenzhenica]
MASLYSLLITGNPHKLETDAVKVSPSLEKVIPFSSLQEKYFTDLDLEIAVLLQNVSFHRNPSPFEPKAETLQPFEPALYVALRQQCTGNNFLTAAKALHAHILKTGAFEDLIVSTSLINAFMKCGDSEHARKLFEEIPQPNVVTWTTLISGYVRNCEAEHAVRVFIQLRESGIYPTNYTLGAIFSACPALFSMELGKQLHGYVIKYQLESDTSIGNSLCSLYSKCRNLESAAKAFRRIPKKNVISWTTVMSACGNNGDADLGLRIFHEMLLKNSMPNEFTLTTALSLCTETQSFELGKQIHAFCVKFGCESNHPVNNSILYFYLKSGETEEAMKLFDSMETVSLITLNAMIAGHAKLMNLAKDYSSTQRRGTTALNMFLRLERSGMKPDLFTFSSVLTVCSDLVALLQGEMVHAQAIKTGFLSDVVVNSALVTMYNKCGCIDGASKAFVEISTRTLISWTSMINAYSQHGRSIEAIQLFEDMRLLGVKPNQITFVGVLSACSHAGLVKEAEYYFDMMRKEYDIVPVMDHYACMVDMFVRKGQLEEAFMFVEKIGFEPNEIIWSILIAGCRSHGNMELCFYAAQRLLEQRPREIETYVLLLNMYLSLGKWQDVAKVMKMMKEENIGTIRDRSWINIHNKMYYFRADDRSYSCSSELYALLESLLEKARGAGYVPYRDRVLSDGDEQKLSSSTVHQREKL